eukprot:5373178-Lingulodinium_polyedra.AAC.1
MESNIVWRTMEHETAPRWAALRANLTHTRLNSTADNARLDPNARYAPRLDCPPSYSRPDWTPSHVRLA